MSGLTMGMIFIIIRAKVFRRQKGAGIGESQLRSGARISQCGLGTRQAAF